MTHSYDVAVLGGGIIGMLTALALHDEGLEVIVLDKQASGKSASRAGGGILSPLTPWNEAPAFTKLCQRSKQLYPGLIERLTDSTRVDPEFITSGMLILEPVISDTFIDWQKQTDDRHELLDETAVKSLLGSNIQFQQALHLPEIAQIRNPLLLKALHQYIKQQGITFYDHDAITMLDLEQSHINSIQYGGELISAAKFILATGAWSGLTEFHANVDVQPVFGQILCYKTAEPLLEKIVLHEERYLIPRKDNILLVGSTITEQGFDVSLSEQSRQDLQQFAAQILPDLDTDNIHREWGGLRPKSQRGLPYICAQEKISNLYLNTGHYRNGILAAPASAELMTDILLERQTIIDKSEFSIHM